MAEVTSGIHAAEASGRRPFPILAHANAANAITSLSIALGIGCSLLALEGRLLPALVLGPLTIVCDVLDGWVARRTGTASAFGAQLDSLADSISFGVLPAMLGHAFGLQGLLVLLPVWFVLGAVWRLARFGEVGMTVNAEGREFFEGVPTTSMAATFYGVAAVAVWWPAGGRWLFIAFFAVGPLLMNSSLPIPKRSAFTRLMWILVPLAVGALCARLR